MTGPGQHYRIRGDVRDALPRLPDRHFKVLYPDPPWLQKSWSAKGDGRSACRHYPVMKLKDLHALGREIQRICSRDCHLFLWATGAHLMQAGALMESWGFEYSSIAFTWVKMNKRAPALFWDAASFFIGMGHTTRKGTEVCLLGRRGRPRRLSRSVREVIFAPVGRHSAKPIETYDRIEQYAAGPMLELFARKTRAGWSAIGNELESDSTQIRVDPEMAEPGMVSATPGS